MGAISETNADNWADIVCKNIKDTQDWIETAQKWGCGITYASSASVYGSWSNSPEWGPVQPQHMYGVSKLTIDNWCAVQNFSVPVQGMRFFNVYGRNEGHKAQPSPIRRYMQQAIARQPLTVWNHRGRLGTRDFVSVDDCILAMIQLKATGVSGVYNIGTGQQLTFEDIAISIQRRFDNVQVQLEPMPEHMVEKYQWESCADLNKLRSTISWNPQSVDQWLDRNFEILYNKIQNENTRNLRQL
jgi:ADP-L-glycero-D-manno-heptose 6-epimerase